MQDDTLPLIGREYPYSKIDGELCLVRRTGLYSKVVNGNITFSPKGMPYGFLEVECKNLPETAMLLITHKVDYVNIWKLSKEHELGDEEELAVIWTNNFQKNFAFKLFKPILPKMWVMVFHKGHYDFFERAKKSLKDYHGKVSYKDFVMPIRDIKPESME